MADALVCRRCETWKDPAEFVRETALPESRVICRACFQAWLDEQWARRHDA
jgi:hypothetical protein